LPCLLGEGGGIMIAVSKLERATQKWWFGQSIDSVRIIY